MTQIYHNPRCSKSRATLAIIEDKGISPEIIEYLNHPPDVETLKTLTQMLGVSIHDIVRKGEDVYRELGLKDKDLSEQEMLEIVVENPKLLERPIVVSNGKAVVGRPPENVLNII